MDFEYLPCPRIYALAAALNGGRTLISERGHGNGRLGLGWSFPTPVRSDPAIMAA